MWNFYNNFENVLKNSNFRFFQIGIHIFGNFDILNFFYRNNAVKSWKSKLFL